MTKEIEIRNQKPKETEMLNSKSNQAKKEGLKILKKEESLPFDDLMERVRNKVDFTIRKDSFLLELHNDINVVIENNIVHFREKVTPKEFTLRAIEKLKKDGHKGIHAVFSGFNSAFRAYFPDKDVIEEVNKLEKEGVVHVIPVKGGVFINPGPKPDKYKQESAEKRGKKALKKLGL